jgi:hypothetical protein
MSHFSVMVVGGDIDEQLAAYNEQPEADSPLLEFNDESAEVLKGWGEDTLTHALRADGLRLMRDNDEAFIKEMMREVTEEEYQAAQGFKCGTGWGETQKRYILRDDVTEIEVPVAEVYADVDAYAGEYHGYHVRKDGTETRYGYLSNPNARWDWYVTGGRWQGFLLLKDGTRADEAEKGDVDWKTMCKEAGEEAGAKWDAVQAARSDLTWEGWHAMRERMTQAGVGIDAIRESYHAQLGLKTFIKRYREQSGERFFGAFDGVDDFLTVTREDYVKAAEDGAIATYAYVEDGQWAQRGEMGWWGMSTDEMDKADWCALQRARIEALPDEALITIVDAHI